MKILCKTCVHFFLRKYKDFSKKEKEDSKCLILDERIPDNQQTFECNFYDEYVKIDDNIVNFN